MNPFRRLCLFIRDWLSELPTAWAIARDNDCQRNGGHRWTSETDPACRGLGIDEVCTRCGSGRSARRPLIYVSPYTTTATASTCTVTFNEGEASS